MQRMPDMILQEIVCIVDELSYELDAFRLCVPVSYWSSWTISIRMKSDTPSPVTLTLTL